MATILINFQQKFALVRSFQHFAIKFVNQKRFFARLKSASKSSLNWRGQCDVFVLELYLAIDPSNLASENDVTRLSHTEAQKCKKQTSIAVSRNIFEQMHKTLN